MLFLEAVLPDVGDRVDGYPIYLSDVPHIDTSNKRRVCAVWLNSGLGLIRFR
jgi:hypothetical protein